MSYFDWRDNGCTYISFARALAWLPRLSYAYTDFGWWEVRERNGSVDCGFFNAHRGDERNKLLLIETLSSFFHIMKQMNWNELLAGFALKCASTLSIHWYDYSVARWFRTCICDSSLVKANITASVPVRSPPAASDGLLQGDPIYPVNPARQDDDLITTCSSSSSSAKIMGKLMGRCNAVKSGMRHMSVPVPVCEGLYYWNRLAFSVVLDSLVNVCVREYAWARRGECVAWYVSLRTLRRGGGDTVTVTARVILRLNLKVVDY
jgi:hypothetical protein